MTKQRSRYAAIHHLSKYAAEHHAHLQTQGLLEMCRALNAQHEQRIASLQEIVATLESQRDIAIKRLNDLANADLVMQKAVEHFREIRKLVAEAKALATAPEPEEE